MKVPRAVVADSVDEQRRGTRHAILAAVREILFDACAHIVAFEVAREAVDVEPDRARDIDEIRLVDRRLAIEKPVVHFEEMPLSMGRLRSSGSKLGARVCAFVREVPEHVQEPVSERFAKARENLAQPPAVGAEKVLVRDDDRRHRRRAFRACGRDPDRPPATAEACRCSVRRAPWPGHSTGRLFESNAACTARVYVVTTYSATHLEAQLCDDEPVAIVGGGNSAGQAAVFAAHSSSPKRACAWAR